MVSCAWRSESDWNIKRQQGQEHALGITAGRGWQNVEDACNSIQIAHSFCLGFISRIRLDATDRRHFPSRLCMGRAHCAFHGGGGYRPKRPRGRAHIFSQGGCRDNTRNPWQPKALVCFHVVLADSPARTDCVRIGGRAPLTRRILRIAGLVVSLLIPKFPEEFHGVGRVSRVVTIGESRSLVVPKDRDSLGMTILVGLSGEAVYAFWSHSSRNRAIVAGPWPA